MIGLGLARHVVRGHGADAAGRVVLCRQLWRAQVVEFFGRRPRCVVAMEACSGARFRGRELARLGHKAWLIPPAYVRPFVRRQKSDMGGAEAMAEAAQRLTRRFVAMRSENSQAAAVVFRGRDLLVRQRTQLIKALCGPMTELGRGVAQGAARVKELVALVSDADTLVPATARPALQPGVCP